MPAVDAVAHEGVDINMAPQSSVVQDAYTTSYATNPYPDKKAAPARAPRGSKRARKAKSGAVTIEHAPQNWTLSSTPAPARPRLLPSPDRASGENTEQGKRLGGLRATVTFRMPAQDFVRLRYASREMKESCQTIIVDAISAYLDANEVEAVDETTARKEAARLAKRRP